jgi:phage baseplate assembly protein W
MTRVIAYPFGIDTHGHIASTSDPRKIWQDRVRAVVNTQIGDRVMRPGFGVDTETAIMNYGTPAENELTINLKNAFVNLLPALNVKQVKASMDSTSAVLTVEVWFTLPDNTLTSTTVTYNAGVVTSETNPYEEFPL